VGTAGGFRRFGGGGGGSLFLIVFFPAGGDEAVTSRLSSFSPNENPARPSSRGLGVEAGEGGSECDLVMAVREILRWRDVVIIRGTNGAWSDGDGSMLVDGGDEGGE